MPAPSARQRLSAFFALGLVLGFTGGALAVLEAHCRSFERAALKDFRMVVFLKGGQSAGALKLAEERLRSIPDVEEARSVSPDESLAGLRREDPELFDAVALVGGNPLPSAVELRLTTEGVGRVPQIAAEAFSSEEVSDVRYAGPQASAILVARFYAYYVGMAVNAALTAASLAILGGLWFGRGAAWPETLLASGGALLGQGAALLLALPMRGRVAWWAAPRAWQMLVWAAACGGAAWSLAASRLPGARPARPALPEEPVPSSKVHGAP